MTSTFNKLPFHLFGKFQCKGVIQSPISLETSQVLNFVRASETEACNVLLGGGIYGFLRCFRQLSNCETLCLIILSKFTRVDQGPVEGRAELGILSKVFLKKLGGGVGYMYTDSVIFFFDIIPRSFTGAWFQTEIC